MNNTNVVGRFKKRPVCELFKEEKLTSLANSIEQQAMEAYFEKYPFALLSDFVNYWEKYQDAITTNFRQQNQIPKRATPVLPKPPTLQFTV